ncbi:hypothetical protein AVEN_248846-1 [Araneus ventricosus]|uniref:Uncharacterized protein n=1 Tax=Araneus ventricosus TaxID=182803 RepID=A0A4Y2MFX5_ARAVE|nr:hypothetical protein AVEN_248846-1 [Araneus ventricosus]
MVLDCAWEYNDGAWLSPPRLRKDIPPSEEFGCVMVLLLVGSKCGRVTSTDERVHLLRKEFWPYDGSGFCLGVLWCVVELPPLLRKDIPPSGGVWLC